MWLDKSKPSYQTLATPDIRRSNSKRDKIALSRLTPIHYKKFDKFLRVIGCVFVSLKRPVVIPAISDIPVFIILNNLRILGISKEEYLSVIENL